MNYYSSIQQAIDYIDNHLQDELQISDIASRASFSAFHFQRLFLAISGFTVHEYIRKRRLSEAAKRLRECDESILDIALSYQYQSQEAFSRAFDSYIGTTPARHRKTDTPSHLLEKIHFASLKHEDNAELAVNKPSLVTLEPSTIIGWAYPTSISKGHHYSEIPGFYHEFGQQGRFMPIEGKVKPGMSYGIAAHFKDNGDFTFIVGEEVDAFAPLPDGYASITIPSGLYAEFKVNGHADLVQQTRDYIYGTWLPNSNYIRREGPDFEITDVWQSVYPDRMRMKIYIPVD